MPRILHGSVLDLATLQVGATILAAADDDSDADVAMAKLLKDNLRAFGFLFPQLQTDESKLLRVTSTTPARLLALGKAMRDPGDSPTNPGDTTGPGIPAAYTYFGQFVDHDITLEAASDQLTPNLLDPNLQPLSVATIEASLKNTRTATLDLDSLYRGDAVRDGKKMALGTVAKLEDPPFPEAVPFLRPQQGGQPKDDNNDLPRLPRNPAVPEDDRSARIGDPRNDENLIVSQLHLAFLRAHIAVVDLGNSFVQARRLMRQHYQHLVLHDFLPRVADPSIVNDVIQNGNQVFDPAPGHFFLPLEYSVAAYRFGHTMVRDTYDYNVNFPAATLGQLFLFTALSGQLGPAPGAGGFDTLPENWIIEWEKFVDAGVPFNKARRLDTKLVEPGLQELRDLDGTVLAPPDRARLAVRNLLRGYLLRMPTGQAVAEALGLTPMTKAQIEAAAGSAEQVAALRAGRFGRRTPLWYYVLAEAAHPALGNGQRLGPVGSTLVAEVMVGLARRSKQSILSDPSWNGPTLPSAQAGTFVLADLLRLAGVLA